MTAYYNENDPGAAAWLRNNIAAGLVAPGIVDTRSIKDVTPNDLKGFSQCHFFAGIGGWSGAARLAGWPDARPLWSASCPCQPFSAAGKGGGVDDPRHLWPDFFSLASAERPNAIVGEQVAGAAGYGWLDGVRADLARENYAGGAVDIPALAVDAPHERNRLYWVAVALGDAEREGLQGFGGDGDRGAGWSEQDRPTPATNGGDMADPDLALIQGQSPTGELRLNEQNARIDYGRNGSWWSGADWLTCHDGKARRVADARAPLLVNGIRGGVPVLRPDSIRTESLEGFPELQAETRHVSRIAAWKGAGNGIVIPLAAEVIAALSDVLPVWRP